MAGVADGGLELILDAQRPGGENMRRDLELLDRVVCGESPGAIRLYGFSPPCLSLGRTQSRDDVDSEACARDGIDIVRRPTGGRAVLHDAEVTYSVTCRTGNQRFGGTVPEACARIHAVVAKALRSLGIETMSRGPDPGGRATAVHRHATPDCFAHPAPNELTDTRGRKLVGSAQARRAGALLQHGSLPLEAPRTALYLRTGAVLDAPGAAGLREVAPTPVDRDRVVAALAQAFRNR